MLESHFNKVAAIEVFSCEICNNFKNIYFEEHLRTTTSVFYLKSLLPTIQ